MRQQLGLFFIGLIALSSVASLSQDIQFLNSLKNTEFGKTLLESVQIELRSSSESDAVTRIEALLNDLKKSVNAEQAKDNKQHKATVKSQKNLLTNLAARIASLNSEIQSDLNLIASNDALVLQAKKSLKHQQKLLSGAQAQLKRNTEVQAETTRVYLDQFARVSKQISGLAQAVQVLKGLSSKSFAQVNQQEFVQLAANLNEIKSAHPKYSGFMNVLAQMLSNTEYLVSNQRLVRNILSLCGQLNVQLVHQSEFLTQAYKVRMADLRLIRSRIEVSVALHTSQIHQLEGKIARLNAQSVSAKQRIADNKQRVSESQVQQRDVQIQLNDQVSAHRQRRTKRSSEVQTIDNVLVIFKTRFTDDVRQLISTL